MMTFHTKNRLTYFAFPQLVKEPDIWHGIFSKKGGSGSPPYDGLNFGVGEKGEVWTKDQSRKMVLSFLEEGRFLFLNQVHGDKVICLDGQRLHKTDQDMKADAMITDQPGYWLVILVADCQGVILIDHKKKVVANIHSGWRGTLKNIIAKTVKTMIDRYHCCPEDIKAGISPSLGPCCGEFKHYKKEIPEAYWKYRVSDTHFDFWAISRSQLTASGILKNQIYESRICTKCNPHLFYSYRHRQQTGRFAVMVGIKPFESGLF